MKNTAEVCQAAGGAKPPKSMFQFKAGFRKQYKKRERHLSLSARLINFVLHMYNQLTSEQRYTISVLLQKKMSKKFIAQVINVSASTVSREISRNSNARGVYDPRQAELKKRRRKSRNPGNRSISLELRAEVFRLIREEQWSPEQVSGRLALVGKKVCKSTIYNWINATSPHCRDNIRKYLRRGGIKCKSAAERRPVLIKNRTSIDERPRDGFGESVGDLEMDTIVGKGGKGAIVTLVDRYSSLLMMRKLDTGKKAVPLAQAVIGLVKEAGIKVRSITTDNGMEFAAHEAISRGLGCKVYFAHPYSSWEKGSIENMNGLIRQYIPKKDSFDNYTHDEIRLIQNRINARPRKKIGFLTPLEVISKLLC